MSSEVSPNASLSKSTSEPLRSYSPRAGISRASDAAAIHAASLNNSRSVSRPTTTTDVIHSCVSSAALDPGVTPMQSSSAPSNTTGYFPRVGTSRASDQAALHASRISTRQASRETNSPTPPATQNRGATQPEGGTPKNIGSPAMTCRPTVITSTSASQAAATRAGSTGAGTSTSSLPNLGPIIPISPRPLSPLVQELAHGPSEDIIRRLEKVYKRKLSEM
ncbi:hypothetical protein D9619_003717 [Psilocybe cf. subviscida]|uniref:Uncharacterized protein n=1 Tax=Psilocybe cf. subviscida TaxID=2480587 RepID=A0A8H5AXZ9_9AGAR|nr:hypothetical protein D9619_003717 [Psilocybe cf. subviscida]